MKKLGQALRRAVLISPLVLFCLLSLALAEKKASDSNQHPPKQASDRLITIRLTMSDNRVILVSQYDNEMITTGPQDGEKLGITPSILDSGAVVLDFSRVTKIIKKGAVVGASTTGIGSVELNSTLPQATPISLVSSIELIGISKMMEGTAIRISLREECPCCVSCGGQQTCGAGVNLSCGSCYCN